MLGLTSITGRALFGDRVPSSANAGSVKPTATMMPRQNRFIVSSTQVQSRACGTRNQSQILQGIAPPWAFPAAFPTQGIGTPRRQLANQKIPPARRLAYRPFGRGSAKKCYTERPAWYIITKNTDLKAVAVISGRCNLASSLFGLDWIDLRLRARSLPLGADACRGHRGARLPWDNSDLERSSVRSHSSSEGRWLRGTDTGAAPKTCPRDDRSTARRARVLAVAGRATCGLAALFPCVCRNVPIFSGVGKADRHSRYDDVLLDAHAIAFGRPLS